jgi:hypothetical protein
MRYNLTLRLSLIRAGGNLEGSQYGISFLPAPPLSLLIDQQFIETTERTSDGDKTQKIYTEQEFFGTCCSVDDSALTLYGITVKMKLDTPSSRKLNFILCSDTCLSTILSSTFIEQYPIARHGK